MTGPTSVSEYIASCPSKVRLILKRVRATIRKAAPRAEEVISYGIPAFKQNGIVAYFAAFKNHIGFYPPTKDVTLRKAAARYAGPKGNLRFPFDEPIPYALISRVVSLRVRDNLKKAKVKAKKKS